MSDHLAPQRLAAPAPALSCQTPVPHMGALSDTSTVSSEDVVLASEISGAPVPLLSPAPHALPACPPHRLQTPDLTAMRPPHPARSLRDKSASRSSARQPIGLEGQSTSAAAWIRPARPCPRKQCAALCSALTKKCVSESPLTSPFTRYSPVSPPPPSGIHHHHRCQCAGTRLLCDAPGR